MIILACLAIVFSIAIDTSGIDNEFGRVFCNWPIYGVGWDTTSIHDGSTCSNVSYAGNYADENIFGLPTGWFTHIGHVLTSIGERIISAFALIILFVIPIPIIASITPLAIPYGFLFVLIIIGVVGKIRGS